MSKKKHKKKHRQDTPVEVTPAPEAEDTARTEAEAPAEAEIAENTPSEAEKPEAPAEAEETAPDDCTDAPEAEKKRRRFPVFWTLYALFVAAFAVSLWYGVRFLTGVLAEYESVQPEYAAEDVFAEHFAEPDIEALIKMSSTEYALFETHEKVIEYLGTQIEGKEITYSESSAADTEGLFTYNVFCGGARFAVFRIEKGADATEHGFPIYVLKDVRLTFSLPDNAYDFVIPEGYTLYANGVKVPESFISGEPILTEAYTVSSGALGVRYIPYRVDGFLSEPTFKVTDRAGEPCELEYNGEDEIGRITAESITLTIPDGYTAYLGGSAVGGEYLVEDSTVPSVYNAYLREDAAPLNYVSYSIHGFLDMPEVTVKGPNGIGCEVRFDEKTLTYESLPAFDESMKQTYESWILGAFEKLTLYLQLVPGSSRDDVIGYFDTSSDIWRAYASMNPDWNYEAYSYEFKDESVSNFIVYDAEHFSCRVRMHYIGHRGTGIHEDITDKIVFFRKIGNRYYICNLVNSVVISGVGAFSE